MLAMRTVFFPITKTKSESIYRLMLLREWNNFKQTGFYYGTPKEQTTGVIHLSPREEVHRTYREKFSKSDDVTIVCVDSERLDGDLRWVQGRGGVYFPHLYGYIRKDAVMFATNYYGGYID